MEFKFNSVEEVLDFASMLRSQHHELMRPQEFLSCIRSIVEHDSKIGAIKLYRAFYGTDLMSTKEVMDSSGIFDNRRVQY